MTSSVRMMMDHLKRYLDEGKAAALVGAGFSRNAMMNEASSMKDWNMLGLDFFQRLYGYIPTGKEAMFLSPIHLASEVEASFGRNELDNLIQQSLPDEVILPSNLHKELMSLNWSDIFTTNYDTLLERAYLDTEKSYSVVSNKETLLYSKHPRIVKLHGSFPNIRPYIITEEDFRTYPQRYPEFVNTVRQALIENMFCLIGFSGDDPNFRSWLGWLRDVMGQQIAPVYLITYDANLHNARRKMLAAQNIDILNLAELPEVETVQEGFEFLFEYLTEKVDTKWSGEIRCMLGSLKTKKDVESITKEMSKVRKTYPGWIFLPKQYYQKFKDIDHDIIGCDLSKIPDLDNETLINFLFELNWRQTISHSPIGVEWFIHAISSIDIAGVESKDELPQKVITLKLSLLTFYRRRGCYANYNELRQLLEQNVSRMTTSQIRRYHYESCQMAATVLDYDLLRKLLANWNVVPTDYVGVIWKSSLLAEIDQRSECVSLLNMSLQHLHQAILTSRNENCFLKSCQTVMHKALRIYSSAEGKDQERPFNPYETICYFKDQLLNPRKKEGKSRTHLFNVGQLNSSYYFGSQRFVESYLFSYRYFALCEACGIPMGLTRMPIDIEMHVLFLNHLLPDASAYGLSLIARSCTNQYVKECLTRKVLLKITQEEADATFDVYLKYAKELGPAMTEALRYRVLLVIIPLLARLTSKSSEDNATSLLTVLFKIYTDYHEYFTPSDVDTIYNNITLVKRCEAQAEALALPIVVDSARSKDVPQKYDHLDLVHLPKETLYQIRDYLFDNDKKVNRIAYFRALVAMHSSIDSSNKGVIEWGIFNWRNKTDMRDLLLDSFRSVPVGPIDSHKPEALLNEDLISFADIDVSRVTSSEIFHRISSLLESFQIFSNLLTLEIHQQVIHKFVDLVNSNEKLLKTDDSNEWGGGFHKCMTDVIRSMEGYIYYANLDNVPSDDIQFLVDAVSKLKEWHFRTLSLRILLCKYDKRLNEASIKKELEENIPLQDSHMDVVQALVFLSKRHNNFQSVLKKVLNFCMYSSLPIVYDWLLYLKLFIQRGVLGEGNKQDVLKMLKHIYNNVEDHVQDIDILNDIYVNACKVAGAAAKIWGDTNETDLWKNISTSDKNVFNEVKHAFDYGYILEKED